MHLRLLIALVGGAATVSCSPLNQNTTIGQDGSAGQVKLEVFTEASAAPTDFTTPPPGVSVSTRPEIVRADEPTSLSLDRASWRTTRFLVPIDGTRHYSTYGKELLYTDSTARQRGEMPTGVSSLELEGDSEGDQITEALVTPFVNAKDLVFLPFRMMWRAPWRVDTSRDAEYDRYQSGLRSTGRSAEATP